MKLCGNEDACLGAVPPAVGARPGSGVRLGLTVSGLHSVQPFSSKRNFGQTHCVSAGAHKEVGTRDQGSGTRDQGPGTRDSHVTYQDSSEEAVRARAAARA